MISTIRGLSIGLKWRPWSTSSTGSQWRRSRLARQTLKELAARKQLSRAEFVDFARTHPALLFPAFQLQGSLRTALGGARMWASIAETRARAADVPPPPPPPLTATGR